ncbi:hypothetical protein CONPUDRAFT_110885 [Coniophora puteana RWD-64-598 SS2]|uniref:RNA polymerase II assembly factor Rtp1 C-terminal domain-containing protein n=1 Tax=Coniophora puteana (strain RWD-64-598) TaxID=741705 RepID=A0A5M3MBZ0_CONPW|nr:uncharacterized protein CONPUDRAFT_110885 [Coniophora puteana RWD-64-598 SS2]EIW76151.1 hypothetical protein CONPUDRAFT_110885 [Coniophora puteana RWD-64-598 SS2]
MASDRLGTLLQAGSALLDTSAPAQRQTPIAGLSTRLQSFYQILGERHDIQDDISLDQLQLETAQVALLVVERVQHLLSLPDEVDDPTQETAPKIGTHDFAQLRTLLSMSFNWSVSPLLGRISPARPQATSAHIVDVNAIRETTSLLCTSVTRHFALLFPDGPESKLPQTLITTTIITRHVADLLKPSITLGWMPRSVEYDVPPRNLQPLVHRLLAILPPSQTIAAIGSILSSGPHAFPHVPKVCSSLLSEQLLRRDGVHGLVAAVFGEGEDVEDAPLPKLEHVARILRTVPAGMKPMEYLSAIVPRVLALLSEPGVPSAYTRAAAFALARMIAPTGPYPHRARVAAVVLPVLHGPLLNVEVLPSGDGTTPTARKALDALSTLLLNADPSPTLISTLLTPAVPALYALLSHLERVRASDALLKPSVRGLLMTWGRVIEAKEAVDTLWSIIQGEGIHWSVDIAGEIRRVEVSNEPPKLSLLTPEDLRKEEETGELDADFLDLYPNPTHFIDLLISLDRTDVSAEVFVRLLQAYHETKVVQEDHDPIKVLLYLQLIMQMQARSSDNSSFNILSKPDHILQFVRYALDSSATSESASTAQRSGTTGGGLSLNDLRIVEEEEDELHESDGDSDDEEAVPGTESTQEAMTLTAINLLLATLEANPGLSARDTPSLNDIFSALEPASTSSATEIRTVAREARMVLTARLASTSASGAFAGSSRTRRGVSENAQEVYQKALKLLQDPVLPVRAHGLLLLRELVKSHAPTRRKRRDGEREQAEEQLDRALVPAILSIFMQSVQDDDSYIFLNAVQGLSAMVDMFGKEVLQGLVDNYSQGLTGISASVLTQQDIDTRVRIGEALGQVIRRCGNALSIYVNILVPPLTAVYRSSTCPVLLRSSAISLLTECIKTDPLALLGYADDISSAMIDLLQLESVQASKLPKPQSQGAEESKGTKPKPDETLDSNPASTNAKIPSLRRAALYFLTLLFKTVTEGVYEQSAHVVPPPQALLRRAQTTLSYIARTDQDNVVRVMAREANEGVEQLEQAMVGL